jgi:hypothetical protein
MDEEVKCTLASLSASVPRKKKKLGRFTKINFFLAENSSRPADRHFRFARLPERVRHFGSLRGRRPGASLIKLFTERLFIIS